MNELELFLQGEGDRRIELIKVAEDANAAAILAQAKRMGFAIDDVLIFIEGHDEPVVIDVVLREMGVRHRHRVHIHRCRHVRTTVHFNHETKHHEFSPHATVAAVKAWFVHAIHMSPTDASEHVLQITGTHDRPDPDLHLGSLVKHGDCAIDFTLVPRKRVEG
jgi:hypothetical protein